MVIDLNQVKYKDEIKLILDSFLLDISLVKPGKMYGHPAYYVKGKLFASLYMEGVCIKIPEKRVKELLIMDGFFTFEPMGRKMREWVFIVRDTPKDYLNDKGIFKESIKYVSSLVK